MNKETYLIAFCLCILATGGYAAMPLFVEMTKIHDISLVQVGLLTSVYIFTQKVTPVFFGPFGDNFGHKKMACLGELFRGIGFFGLAFFNPYSLLLLFVGFAGTGGGVAGPSLKALIMLSADPQYWPKVSALRSTALNVALVAGPALAGVVIFFGWIRGIFLTAGACYLLGVGLIWFFIHSVARPKVHRLRFSFSIYKEIACNRRFIFLLVFMFLVWMLFAQLFVTMPNYAKTFTPHIEQLFFINGVMGMLLGYPIGQIMSKRNRPGFFLSAGSVLFLLAFFTFGFVHNLIGLYMGIVLFTLGELLLFPIVETLVAQCSSDDRNMAAYFGASSLSDGLGRPMGSFFGALLFGMVPSASVGWYVLASISCGLLLIYFFMLRKEIAPSSPILY